MKHIKVIIKTIKLKKGFTLLELVISMVIIDIIIATIMSVYLVIIKDYKNKTTETTNDFYVLEAFRIIEHELANGNAQITIDNNIIKIKKWNSDNSLISIENYIELQGNKVIIVYTKNGFTQTTNNIIKNIEYFHAQIENSLLIVELKCNKGKVYKKCIEVN